MRGEVRLGFSYIGGGGGGGGDMKGLKKGRKRLFK